MDVARKEGFGTARNTASRVWFTLADGMLSDVFSPTIENSNVNTVQYIVTDGKTFADLQQRDMTYSVSSIDPSGPFAAQVVAALLANRPFRAQSSGFVGTPSDGLSQLDRYYKLENTYQSADAAEDKTYAGAFGASPTDPWGQSVPATTTHPGWTYREVSAHDSYETFTGLVADGDLASARNMVKSSLTASSKPTGSFPRNSEPRPARRSVVKMMLTRTVPRTMLQLAEPGANLTRRSGNPE